MINPDEIKNTAIYPDIEIHTDEWTYPLKEGGIQNKPDEITVQASTIYEGITFSERYVISISSDELRSKAEEHLKNKINKTVEAFYNRILSE